MVPCQRNQSEVSELGFGDHWKLELPMEQKRLLRSLVQAHSANDSLRSGDMVEGKGRGLVLLFHGPPGVGKTLTGGKHFIISQSKPLTYFQNRLRKSYVSRYTR